MTEKYCHTHQTRQEMMLYALVSVFLFIYMALRAYKLPLLNDETASLLLYVIRNHFIPDLSRDGANNHILNTLLGWVSVYFFGESRVVLRLHGLVFLVIYIIFTFKLAAYIQKQALRVLFYGAMLGAHYVVEFFPLFRGYGMSLAMLLGAFYALLCLIKSNRIVYSYLFTVFVVLALMANLNMLIPLLVMAGIWLVFTIVKFPTLNVKQLVFLIIHALLLFTAFLLAIVYGFKLREAGGLYLGEGSDHFWHNTLQSLLDFGIGQAGIAAFVYYLLMVLIVILGLFMNRSKDIYHWFSGPAQLSGLVFTVSYLIIFVWVYIMGMSYPEDRLILYMFPLSLLAFTFRVDAIERPWSMVLLLPLLAIPLHFFTVLNTSYTHEYRHEAVPDRFYRQIQKHNLLSESYSTLGGDHMQALSWAYHNRSKQGGLNSLEWQDFPEPFYDFLIAETWAYSDLYDSIDYAEGPGLFLLKRKSPLTAQPFESKQIMADTMISSNEFIGLWSLEGTYLSQKNWKIDVILKFDTPVAEPNIWLVMDAQSVDEKNRIYRYRPFSWVCKDMDRQTNTFHQTILLLGSGKNFEVCKIYLWNINRAPIRLHGCEISRSEIGQEGA